jgi:hypothetical protein
MRLIAAIAALSFLLSASPAHAQDTVMKALDFGMLRSVTTELGNTVADEGIDEDGDYYFEVSSETGLMFYLYGAGCSEEDPAAGCLGLNMIASFTLEDEADAHEVMDSISYAFMKLYRSGDDIKASRYVIFDGGITRENMKENVSVFVQIADAIWDQLIDLDVLAQ